ncbi:MAG TPA: spore germination protein [Symbiobacteriaceae bacterium]|nr:spore germination protein [Symbiobacteriaceae bacterium]
MLPAQLSRSEQMVRQALGASEDILFQKLRLQAEGRLARLIWVEGMISGQRLDEFVITPLATEDPKEGLPPTLTELGHRMVHVGFRKEVRDPAKVRDMVLRGHAALLVDGYAGALIIGVQDWAERSVDSPPSETGLRGPRDGFTENIVTNINLVRRRINDAQLVLKYWRVGARSKTRVAVLHIDDIARKRLVDEIHSRVAAIEFDGLIDSHQLRELLVATPWSHFPKMLPTERPDRVASALLAGKVVVMVDNSPFALIAPVTLMETLFAADDYYSLPLVTSMVRAARAVGALATLLLSPGYIGIMMFNPGLVRSDLAIYLARERAGVPLTPALEVFFLEGMMEVLHEATVRLPSKVGSAATVVGGLIIGQAAVEARLLSANVVIVAAISAIGSFTLPSQEMGQVWRATKWLLIIAASLFGVYGAFAGAYLLFSWLASQDSFGTPYLAPVAPLNFGDLLRESILRRHWGSLRKRPHFNRPQDPDRTPQRQNTKYWDGGER